MKQNSVLSTIDTLAAQYSVTFYVPETLNWFCSQPKRSFDYFFMVEFFQLFGFGFDSIFFCENTEKRLEKFCFIALRIVDISIMRGDVFRILIIFIWTNWRAKTSSINFELNLGIVALTALHLLGSGEGGKIWRKKQRPENANITSFKQPNEIAVVNNNTTLQVPVIII